ncbi:MAG: quinohemoprotein amine dehydrogenase subunit alpha [Bryobacteraceae bacterium]
MRPLATLLLALPILMHAQDGPERGRGRGRGATDAAKPVMEEGIPVTDPLVIAKCSGCHKKDEKGNLSRISWERTTPEGWQEAIKRMVRLNGLVLKPEEARAIVKSLSTDHGLAPEEAKPVMYFVEHRIQDEELPNETVREACAACHPIARARSWHRSKEDWDLLVNMHRGYFIVSEQSFRGRGGPGEGGGGGGRGAAAANGTPVDTRPASDQAVEYLAKDFPLNTPAWAAWRARMRAPKLTGRWLITGYQAGRGKVTGEMVIEPGASEDEFTTNVKLTYLRDGSTATRSGKSVVYTGYSWRGRSTTKNAADPSPQAAGGVPAELRETMWIAPDQNEMEGRWFWGAYEEFGYDVTLHRASDGVTVTGTDVTMIKTGSAAQKVKIYGDNFPKLTAADIDFGTGVTIKRIVEQTAHQATVEVDVDAKAIVGKRDVAVRRTVAPNAIAVYDKIDYIKVSPDTALARLGGEKFPKGYQQFEAIAYNRGPDGKPNTPDDVELGPVEAEWSLEEFYAVYGDDDKEFVGKMSPTGFFIPSVEGPNPKRKFSRNNYGDVWAVATYNGAQDREGKPLTARSYLVVAIPLYVRWDEAEGPK